MRQAAPIVSVLTPVFNGAEFIGECIDSVRCQTLESWEYFIVDNCSSDRTVMLAERYAAADRRIRVVRCTQHVNVHCNFSRSVHLMHPRARYCKFLSADDLLYPACLERMVAAAERHPSVGVVSSYRRDDRRITQTELVPYPADCVSGREVLRATLLGAKGVTGSPSQLLYRADLVRATDPFFDESVWHSDTDAAFRTLLQSDLGFVHEVLTYTRRHPAALTSDSNRVNTYLPHEIRMLIRFGRQVLGVAEYRGAMRLMLARYARFLVRQAVRRPRWRDSEFHAYHRNELDRMLAELGRDQETRLALQGLRLLTRGHSHRSARSPSGRATTQAPSGLHSRSSVAHSQAASAAGARRI